MCVPTAVLELLIIAVLQEFPLFYVRFLYGLQFCLSDLSVSNLTRMDRQRREEEQRNRSSKKAPDAEQSILNRVWTYDFLYNKLEAQNYDISHK